MDKLSYALGLGIGRQLADMKIENLNVDDFAQAIKDVIGNKDLFITNAEAQKICTEYFQQKEEEAAKAARAVGENFLSENAKKEGVTVLASGLQYEVLTEGTGKKPKATDKVRCHYAGTLVDGTEFDSSYKRGEPADFPLNGVIAGWTEGVQLMSEGAKYRFYIPYNLGYGAQGAGAQIPPYSALIFDVELIKVL